MAGRLHTAVLTIGADRRARGRFVKFFQARRLPRLTWFFRAMVPSDSPAPTVCVRCAVPPSTLLGLTAPFAIGAGICNVGT